MADSDDLQAELAQIRERVNGTVEVIPPTTLDYNQPDKQTQPQNFVSDVLGVATELMPLMAPFFEKIFNPPAVAWTAPTPSPLQFLLPPRPQVDCVVIKRVQGGYILDLERHGQHHEAVASSIDDVSRILSQFFGAAS